MSLGLLTSLFILSFAVFIIMVVLGDWSYHDYRTVIGVISIFSTITFGLMFWGYAMLDWKEFKVIEYKPIITKSEYKIFVEYDFSAYGFEESGTEIYTSKEDYETITDTTKFYVLIGINHYGNEFEAVLGLRDSLCNFPQNVPIETPRYIEDKYDSK